MEEVEERTSEVTQQLEEATEPDSGSLLPLDLNATNFAISSLLDISEESNATVETVSIHLATPYNTGRGLMKLMPPELRHYVWLVSKGGRGTPAAALYTPHRTLCRCSVTYWTKVTPLAGPNCKWYTFSQLGMCSDSVEFVQNGSGGQSVLENAERYGLLLANDLNDTDAPLVLSRPNIGTVIAIR